MQDVNFLNKGALTAQEENSAIKTLKYPCAALTSNIKDTAKGINIPRAALILNTTEAPTARTLYMTTVEEKEEKLMLLEANALLATLFRKNTVNLQTPRCALNTVAITVLSASSQVQEARSSVLLPELM
jgi:hypothetical protein